MQGLNTFHTSGKLPSLKIWSSAPGELEWCKALLAEKQHQKTWYKTLWGLLKAGEDGSFHWSSIWAHSSTHHTQAGCKMHLLLLLNVIIFWKGKRCSPMGLCEAFTCVKVEVFCHQWVAWREPSCSEHPSWLGQHRIHFQQGWCDRQCPTLGQGGFPQEETCRCSWPCSPGCKGHPNSWAGKGSCKADLSSLCFTLEHKGVELTPWWPGGRWLLPFSQEKIMVLVTILRKRSKVGRKAQITKKPGM